MFISYFITMFKLQLCAGSWLWKPCWVITFYTWSWHIQKMFAITLCILYRLPCGEGRMDYNLSGCFSSLQMHCALVYLNLELATAVSCCRLNPTLLPAHPRCMAQAGLPPLLASVCKGHTAQHAMAPIRERLAKKRRNRLQCVPDKGAHQTEVDWELYKSHPVRGKLPYIVVNNRREVFQHFFFL